MCKICKPLGLCISDGAHQMSIIIIIILMSPSGVFRRSVLWDVYKKIFLKISMWKHLCPPGSLDMQCFVWKCLAPSTFIFVHSLNNIPQNVNRPCQCPPSKPTRPAYQMFTSARWQQLSSHSHPFDHGRWSSCCMTLQGQTLPFALRHITAGLQVCYLRLFCQDRFGQCSPCQYITCKVTGTQKWLKVSNWNKIIELCQNGKRPTMSNI